MRYGTRWTVIGMVAGMALVGLAGPAQAQKPGPAAPGAQAPAPTPSPKAAGNPADQFKAAGKGAALTVVPARMAGRPFPQVGDVVALMLEHGGMTNLETSRGVFTPPEGADLGATAKAFAEFVKANPTPTEYALFVEFTLSREAGVSEVRGVVANTRGEVVWQDRQVKGDADFDRIKPGEPMDCCLLIAERLRPVLGLGDPTREDGSPGKIARRWQKESGTPDTAETAAIGARGAAFKKTAAGASLIVYPAHAGEAYSVESAKGLAAMLNEQKLTKATGADTGPRLEVEKAMNEQKMLWAMAHAFSDWVKKNPPSADYVLMADYLMGKEGVGGVHFAICNTQGELVVVDFQNSHWPDFQAIDPKTREDCDRLVVKRLQGYCK